VVIFQCQVCGYRCGSEHRHYVKHHWMRKDLKLRLVQILNNHDPNCRTGEFLHVYC
jgi:hypothetical protein